MNDEQIRKIRALALYSTNEGERDNARRILERLKAPLHEETEEMVEVHLKWRTKYEKLLAKQISYAFSEQETGRFRKKTLIVQCTLPQAEQIKFLYEVYRREMNETMERAVHAFIQVNGIFRPGPPVDRELTQEEAKRMALAMAMDKTRIPRSLLKGSKE
jgi:hypothetical protein